MKLHRGKMDYKVPLFERIECIYLDDKKNGFRWTIALVSNTEMAKMLKKTVKQAKLYSIPAYASYLPMAKNGMLSFYPPPDKGYEAKCRYITTNEF